MRGNQESQLRRAAVRRQAIRELRQRVRPVGWLERSGLGAEQRLLQPFVSFYPPVVEPADVAHPVAVHVGIETWRRANELRAFRPLRLRLDPSCRVAAL